MLDVNTPINGITNINNLSLEEKTPIFKLNIRGKANNKNFTSSIGKILGIILPTQVGSIISKEYISVITIGPNEWLLISNNKTDNNLRLEEILFENISKNKLGAVTNITDQFTIFSLVGSNIFKILSKSSPFDFDKLPNDFSAQTLLNGIDVTIIKKDENNVDLLVRRSFSKHLWLWLCDSARFL